MYGDFNRLGATDAQSNLRVEVLLYLTEKADIEGLELVSHDATLAWENSQFLMIARDVEDGRNSNGVFYVERLFLSFDSNRYVVKLDQLLLGNTLSLMYDTGALDVNRLTIVNLEGNHLFLALGTGWSECNLCSLRGPWGNFVDHGVRDKDTRA